MDNIDIAGTIRTLATLVRLHEGNLDAEVNALLDRAETCAAASAALIEAIGLRANWVNGSWYVDTACGTAYSGIAHATESAARVEIDEAIASAIPSATSHANPSESR